MKRPRNPDLPFNTPLETGIRSVAVLVAAHPRAFDLQRLVAFDHLIVHTGDIGGPESLHPELPMRSAELLVRRGLVERGLLLMVSRRLIHREPCKEGILYRAGELAETFLLSLTSPYLTTLRERAQWVTAAFGAMDDDAFRTAMTGLFDRWFEEFQYSKQSLAGEA